MISRKSSSQLSFTSSDSSRKSSLSTPASTIEDGDVEKEESMFPDESPARSRPLSVSIPRIGQVHGPYCPRRPTLREILANTSPPPWTLAAFMAYLSNNHCLETLEFTMDAGRYRKHYAKMMSRASGGMPPAKDAEYVQALWHRLIDAYIRPNGSREVNLPSDTRDAILNLQPGLLPPAPDQLDSAVAKTYELMEESVLVPFLNSCYPQTAHPAGGSYQDVGNDGFMLPVRAHDTSPRRSRHARDSPPPQSAVDPYSSSYHPPSVVNRKSAPSTITTGFNKARFSVNLSPTTSAPAAPVTSDPLALTDSGSSSQPHSNTPGMTDDSGSNDSGMGESPMTPPTTPPMGDASPKRDSGMWKKFGRLSGMKVDRRRHLGASLRED